jgi:8-oxo-dGTP pyrophosphatase MutT (NUDIX family)
MILDDLRSTLSTEINPVLKRDGKHKLASVLVVIYGNSPIVLMTEKPKHMKFHAGEISFPGGKLDSSDDDLLETALRETSEEIGLTVKKDQVIGQLNPVVTLNSGFKILPFVSILDDISILSPNAEVKKIFHIPLEPFLQTMKDDPDPTHHLIQEMYTFEYQGKIVWGASARVLKQIVDCLKS